MREEMTLEELACKIGHGFHPDTPGDEYTTLPEGITPEMVDAIIDDAWDADDGNPSMNVYTRTYLALHKGETI